MPQPRKQTRRTGAGTRSTKSTAGGSRSQGARARTTRAAAAAKPAAAKAAAAKPAEVDEGAGERIRELNERIIETGKRAGRGTLDLYESTLKAIADTIERVPGSSDIEWVSKVATTQANFLRDVSKALTSAARDALK